MRTQGAGRMSKFLRTQFLLIWLGATFCFVGCKKNAEVFEAKIHGTVKMDGTPLKSGSILFTSTDTKTAGKVSSATITDGRYEISTYPGEKLVSITAQQITKTKLSPAPNAPEINMPSEQLVSAKYNVESKLKIVIKPGDNPNNFDTESKKKVGR
jgi:hypothetical protein